MKFKLDPTSIRALSVVAVCALTVAVLALYFGKMMFSNLPIVLAIQIAAGMLMLWARLTFGKRSFNIGAPATAGPLVTSGPYHFIRHPIYAAILLFTCAGAFAHPTVISVSLATII